MKTRDFESTSIRHTACVCRNDNGIALFNQRNSSEPPEPEPDLGQHFNQTLREPPNNREGLSAEQIKAFRTFRCSGATV